MDPTIGAALIAVIQAVASAAKQMGMGEEEAKKYFEDGYQGVKDRPPGALPDAK